MIDLESIAAAEILQKFGPALGLLDNRVQRDYAVHIEQGIRIARAAGHGAIFAEAETGTGKSIAYLLTAGLDCLRNNARAIIGVNAIALLHQIIMFDEAGRITPSCDMGKMRALLRAATNRDVTAAVRLGRRQFVCPERAAAAGSRLLVRRKLSSGTRAALEAFLAWARENPGGLTQTWIEAEDQEGLPGGLTLEDVCVMPPGGKFGSRADSPAWIRYREHVQASLNADILVTTHAMLVVNSYRARNTLLHAEDDSREVGMLIVDEADRLESAAQSACGDQFSLNALTAGLAAWSETHRGKVVDGAARGVDLLRECLREYGPKENARATEDVVLWSRLPDRARRNVLAHLGAVADALSPFLRERPKATADPLDLERLAVLQDYAETARAFVEAIEEPQGDIVAIRYSPSRHFPSLRILRLYPARVLKRMWDVWTAPRSENAAQELASAAAPVAGTRDEGSVESAPDGRRRAKALVLTSATLSVPDRNGAANYMETAMGYGVYGAANPCDFLNRAARTFVPESFGSLEMVFSDPLAPPVFEESGVEDDTDDEEGSLRRKLSLKWADYGCLAVKAALARDPGRVLILANSYPATELLAECLRRGGVAVIEKTRERSTESCIRAFIADPKGVFVTPCAWEGFDISQRVGPDGKRCANGIRHVMISQVPRPAPDGVYEEAFVDHLVAKKGVTREEARRRLYLRTFNMAWRRLKQGFGRGIRGNKDHFTCWLLDPRFPRSALAGRLPGGTSASRGYGKLKLAIPERFRDSVDGDSPWESGAVLLADGKPLSPGEIIERLASPLQALRARSRKKAAARR